MKLPILYSFRRCPYAIRARLALIYANIALEHREISLKNKPEEMLTVSPKATVPVLVLDNGDVIDESLDIMAWALAMHDPDEWGVNINNKIIVQNDTVFKPALDIYKYSDRYSYDDCSSALDACLEFLNMLERTENREMLTDMAIFPFVRQFSKVDPEIFVKLDIPYTHKWLDKHIASDLFTKTMEKRSFWNDVNY